MTRLEPFVDCCARKLQCLLTARCPWLGGRVCTNRIAARAASAWQGAICLAVVDVSATVRRGTCDKLLVPV